MIYRARARQMGYGRPLGVLMLEENIPCPPGTPGNPTTFSCPVYYEIVRGVGIASLKRADGEDSLGAFLEAAHRLMDRDVCAITGNCGLMIVHQDAIARHVPVPVFMSSLLQLPWIQWTLGPGAAIGVVASTASSLSVAHLELAARGVELNVALTSMEGKPHFRSAIVEERGVLDADAVCLEVRAVVRDLARERSDLAAILFECADLPPYAAKVQEEIGLPVFDITTLAEYVMSGLRRERFRGVY